MTRHQHLALVLVAAGCGAEPREAATTPTVASVIATPAAIVVTLPATATPAPTISEQLSNAPALIYRELDTGAMNARSTLTTRKLQRFEETALLTVHTQTVNNRGDLMATHLAPFDAPAIRKFIGSVTTTGELSQFDLGEAGEQLKLECEMGAVQVAAATAVRRSSRQGGCNGDRGHWVPGATKRVSALRCGINRAPDGDDQLDRVEEMAFVASPGIEFLFVNDDCVMQGGGYRFIAADFGVGAIRTPEGR